MVVLQERGGSQCERAAESLAERASVHFETPPGQQSQIDWGQARIHLGFQPAVVHLLELTARGSAA